MQVEIIITSQPIAVGGALPDEFVGVAGAVAQFTGLVRGEEDGGPIAALEYEAYQPMAERVMRQIAADLARQHPCLFLRVTHRVGRVPAGEAAIHLVIAARHRAPAFAMMTAFMDRLKQDVPIWKCRALTRDQAEAATSP